MARAKKADIAAKAGRSGGFTMAGMILAGMVCARLSEACDSAGGEVVLAGTIAATLSTAWNLFKAKVLDK